MTEDDIIYVDHTQLRARGWTRGLVERFLHAPDRWGSVNHFRNYKGKALYYVEWVMLTESHQDFKAAYDASVKRRKLSSDTLAEIDAALVCGNDQYRVWLTSLSPEQVRTMVFAEEVAAIFEEARVRGYRTPHK